MKMSKLLKATVLLLAVGMFSCLEEEEDVCTSDNICDPDQVEQIVTVCEDSDGNTTYMVGGTTYNSLAAASAAITCSSTSEANIMEKLVQLSKSVSAKNL